VEVVLDREFCVEEDRIFIIFIVSLIIYSSAITPKYNRIRV
jgi:hypothetical protein